MNRRLNRVLDEIEKAEKKMAEWQERLRELNVRRKQMEDAEILKCIRSTKLEGRELLEFLAKVQEGSAAAPQDAGEPETEENNTMAPEDAEPEREDMGNEKEG